MRNSIFLLLVLLSSCSHSAYYIVRHAEKEGDSSMTGAMAPSSDVTLSNAGKQRAELLKQKLVKQRIHHIYATGTIRAKATAKPLSEALRVEIETYKAVDSLFIKNLKNLKGSVLVVGHSNTVDDLVNALAGSAILKDLPDSAYGDLFKLQKRGKRLSFSRDHFGR